MLAVNTLAMFGMGLRDSDDSKQRIETETSIHLQGTGILRTPDYYEVDAYLFLKTGEVEISLYNIGTADVYIMDNSGQTIDYSSVNTDIPSTIYLSTNGPGCYYLVIISDTCYAEGAFAI